MVVELTPQQHAEIDRLADHPINVIDPATHERYVLVPLELYEQLRDANDQHHLRRANLAALSRRLSEEE